MSIRAINWALNEVTDITATQKAILISLADRANEDHQCWPSYDDICERSCANRKTVVKALRDLEQKGHITRVRRYSASTVYTLSISTENGSISRVTKMGSIKGSKMGSIRGTNIGSLTTIEPSKEPSYKKRFDEFWQMYPKKVAKPKAEKSFKALSVKDQKAVLESVPSYPFSTEKQYIPNPTTFLNQRRWEDEVDTKTKSTGSFEI